MEIQQILEKTGLNEKEAMVYLALLELGSATGYAIATKAELKRPTTYVILEGLEQRGLVSRIPQGSKVLFTAESPEYLLTNVRRTEELLQLGLPELLALYNKKKQKPRVQLFAGKEGINQVYKKIFDSGEVWFFGITSEQVKFYPEIVQDFTKIVRMGNLKVRDLITDSAADRQYALTVGKSPYHFVRVLPEGSIVLNDNALFGNSVVFFSFQPEVFAVMITSKEVSQSLKTLYNITWESAKPFKQ